MRSLIRGCAAAAASVVVSGAMTGFAPPAAADTSFQVQTAATGVHFTLTQVPASSIITASLVDDATAYTAAAYDASGGSEAQAAALFPGNLVVQGPALFCTQVFSCPVTPPDYPLLADASYPRRQHAAATANQRPAGSGAFVATPANATATATGDGEQAQTTSAKVSALGGSATAMSVGSSTSATKVTATASAVVVHVEAVASDIHVGGLLHIGSVVAVDDVTLRPHRLPTDSPHITVSGVTVAGVPASIDERGVHVAGHDGPSLAQKLAQRGVTVRSVGVDRRDTTSVARSVATGLDVTMSLPVSGLPYVPNPLPAPFDQIPGVNANGTYVGHATIGAVGVVAGANAEPGFSLGGVSPLGPAGGTAQQTASTTGTPAAAAGVVGGAAPGAVAPPALAGPRSGTFVPFLDGFRTDLADLYAVLAIGTALLFILWRGTVALRRRPVTGRRG